MGDSKNQWPYSVPQNSRALIIWTTKNGPLGLKSMDV